MLFDFKAFVDELREKEDKKEIVEKYEKLFGPIQGDIKNQKRYTEYVSNFEPLPYETPADIRKDFDWDLLIQLVVSSFSSDYEYKKTKDDKGNEKIELYISVRNGDQTIVKTVSELWSFQVLRLYEIYIEEQMNLHSLKYEDEKEKGPIDQEREVRKRKREAVQKTLDISAEKEKASKEQQSKLDSLYDQL